MITQARVLELFEYRDGVLFWRKNKRQPVKGKPAGYVTCFGYLQTGVDGGNIQNHRLIWLYHHGWLPDFIDHINGDRLDNGLKTFAQRQKHKTVKMQKNNHETLPE